jgi:hypothetical protein
MVAVGGAVAVGITHSTEVRGDTEMPAVLDAVPEAETADALSGEDPGAYLASLRAEDYTTYTDPVHGFSFDYPKEFALLSATWEDEEVVDVYHPTLALGIRVRIQPVDPDGELAAWLTSLPEEYELEPPDGAQSGAVGWIDQDTPAPGEHRGVYWFRAHDQLVEIQLMAPDVEWLQSWMREFVHTDFRLTPPADEL